jgi:hypothetical protein
MHRKKYRNKPRILRTHTHASDSKDIVALQGINAQKAGFGIGMGLEYEKID